MATVMGMATGDGDDGGFRVMSRSFRGGTREREREKMINSDGEARIGVSVTKVRNVRIVPEAGTKHSDGEQQERPTLPDLLLHMYTLKLSSNLTTNQRRTAIPA